MIPLINTRRRGRIYSINLNTTTSEAFQALLKLDDTFVGT